MKDKDQPEKGIDAEHAFQTNNTLPEWQLELGNKELQNIADGNTQLIEWKEARKQFRQ